MAAAAAKFGAMQLISANASQTPEQIVANSPPGQVFGWQLYVQQDRAKSEAMLARVNAIPQIKFICLTLDAPVPGKREHDERSKNVAANLPVRSSVQSGSVSETSPAPTLLLPAQNLPRAALAKHSSPALLQTSHGAALSPG